MKDKTEITFMFEQSDDNTQFILTLVSPEAMSETEYICALEDFTDSLKQGNIEFLSETTDEMH